MSKDVDTELDSKLLDILRWPHNKAPHRQSTATQIKLKQIDEIKKLLPIQREAYDEGYRVGVETAVKTHHKQYPDCPPRLLEAGTADTTGQP